MFDMFSAADTDGDDAQLTKSEFLKNIRREDLDRVLRPIGGLDMRRVVDGWNGAFHRDDLVFDNSILVSFETRTYPYQDLI